MGVTGAGGLSDGIVFDGQRFKVRVTTLPQAVGGVRRFEIVESPAAAAVVPILAGHAEPHVVLVEQDRPVIGQRTWEVPAGLHDPMTDEQPEETARRELREETGYTAGTLQHLASVYPSPGISTELIHIYLAPECSMSGQTPGPQDPTEISGLRAVPLREAVAMVARGEIQDGKTIAGLLLARDALGNDRVRRGQPQDVGGGPMPFDPTNIPQSMTPAPSSDGPSSGGDKTNPGALSLESILTQEFGYANVTAYQAMEDRARIFGLYLTLVGVLGAALGAVSQFGNNFDKQFLLPIAAFLLLLAGVLGNVFFTKLIRVRQAWRGSALAMTRIKEYYIERLKPDVPDIEKAFLWRLETLPKGERTGSITYLVCYTTAVIGSLSTALAIFLSGIYLTRQNWIQQVIQSQGVSLTQPWFDAALYGVFLVATAIVFFVQLHRLTDYYQQQLSEKKEVQEIKKQEKLLHT